MPESLHGVLAQVASELRVTHDLAGKDDLALGRYGTEIAVKSINTERRCKAVRRTHFLGRAFWLDAKSSDSTQITCPMPCRSHGRAHWPMPIAVIASQPLLSAHPARQCPSDPSSNAGRSGCPERTRLRWSYKDSDQVRRTKGVEVQHTVMSINGCIPSIEAIGTRTQKTWQHNLRPLVKKVTKDRFYHRAELSPAAGSNDITLQPRTIWSQVSRCREPA